MLVSGVQEICTLVREELVNPALPNQWDTPIRLADAAGQDVQELKWSDMVIFADRFLEKTLSGIEYQVPGESAVAALRCCLVRGVDTLLCRGARPKGNTVALGSKKYCFSWSDKDAFLALFRDLVSCTKKGFAIRVDNENELGRVNTVVGDNLQRCIEGIMYEALCPFKCWMEAGMINLSLYVKKMQIE